MFRQCNFYERLCDRCKIYAENHETYSRPIWTGTYFVQFSRKIKIFEKSINIGPRILLKMFSSMQFTNSTLTKRLGPFSWRLSCTCVMSLRARNIHMDRILAPSAPSRCGNVKIVSPDTAYITATRVWVVVFLCFAL